MIPLRDNIRHQRFPWVTFSLILLNCVVFIFQANLEFSPRPWRGEILVHVGGIIPAAVSDSQVWQNSIEDLQDRAQLEVQTRYLKSYGIWRSPRAEIGELKKDFRWATEHALFLGWLTLLTSLFLHGGFLHLAGNMWFLWIFGGNVEDRIGRTRFLIFYLLCGIAAGYTHIATNPESRIPTIGASGAIGGVLGAYILLFPQARVLTFIPIFILLFLREIPAWIFLGIWFLLEFAGAQSSLFFQQDRQVGGIAHWAHVGGFLAGFLLIRLFTIGKSDHRRIQYTIR